MRTPSWEAGPGWLATLLNSATQAYMVDLYTITLTGGQVLRYTNADQAVTVNGNTYAMGPALRRGKTRLNVGISVDSLDVTLAADASVTVNGVPLLRFVANGGFDGARLLLERAYASAPVVWGSSGSSPWVGTLPLFQGRVGVPHATRFDARLAVNSDAELLNVRVPRNLYQPACSNTLFDTACVLSKVLYAYTAAATGASDVTRTGFQTALPQSSGYFALGFVVCNTGPNAGLQRTVRSFDSGYILTIQPWPQAVAVGNTFTVYPGCDKTQATCSSKFNNLDRFRGAPYIPAPETIT